MYQLEEMHELVFTHSVRAQLFQYFCLILKDARLDGEDPKIGIWEQLIDPLGKGISCYRNINSSWGDPISHLVATLLLKYGSFVVIPPL